MAARIIEVRLYDVGYAHRGSAVSEVWRRIVAERIRAAQKKIVCANENCDYEEVGGKKSEG